MILLSTDASLCLIQCKKCEVDLTLKRSSQLQLVWIHPDPAGGGPPPFVRV